MSAAPRVGLVLVALLTASCGDGGRTTPTSPTTPTPDPATLSITCPPPVVTATTGITSTVTYPAPTTTGGRAPVTVTCSPFSGATFPLGTTTVACQALDAQSTAAACSFTVFISKIPTLARTRFLAFGDSTTAGEITVVSPTSLWDEGAQSGRLILVPSASYPTQLLGLLTARYQAQTAAIQVTNAGQSGELASLGAQRFPSVMSAVRPDVVLLLEGYNDLNLYGSAGISIGIGGLDRMAKEARNRGARVVIASLTPPKPGGKNSIDPSNVVEFNSRARALASGEGAVFVDLYAALLPNVALYIGSDGLHPTEAGYRRMAEEFFAAIRANFEQPDLDRPSGSR